uniref:Uncharacterized protein n=1 Tax=Strigamia maritima TaxID=126957 RepID=T1JAW4_STRMM
MMYIEAGEAPPSINKDGDLFVSSFSCELNRILTGKFEICDGVFGFIEVAAMPKRARPSRPKWEKEEDELGEPGMKGWMDREINSQRRWVGIR